MKIIGYETYIVPPRWGFLKIMTDEGIVGWGEPCLEGRTHTVHACIDELMEYLVGKDPRDIEDHWNVLYRASFYRGGPIMMSALAGIDQALWDIKGKALNTPVYQLLGGKCRDRMRMYSWIGGDRPDDVARMAKERLDLGFTAIKMNATEELNFIDDYSKVDAVLARVQAIRDATNRDFGIGIDFHGRVHKPMAKVLMRELAPFNPMFVEEPLLAEHLDAIKEIAQYGAIPIATGERMFSRWEFKSVLMRGGIDILQPDVSHCGGITELKKIANMAEAFDVALAPHCPLGPIALASSLHIDTVCLNAVIQEQSIGIHYNKDNDVLDYMHNKEVYHFKNGYCELLTEPGLGIQVNEEFLQNQRLKDPKWRNPIWRNKDGSFAEW
ncbi:galactonate dehydratase [Canicola haemoglobinophilus]|uniref:D-galactonate dehydratase n=1 Tax=Canicola haemoglobinophilus TaxID=733 RepID=A0A1V4AZU2_9PAST|nr:galactonate dehydratase [Canicola haemoglobinophilus]OOR98837.1 galactonate dehydratase [Canicola haemoglobinophilus]STO53665.1 D-galactonate dehydratase [Canicola haemoglobinophilus]STO60927.1 D-galactonate dehydratase [Canicola haemoglobinophilus]STO68199.1 D-galactonate dehydratase [Canicola haemoglobinophilus]